MSTDPLECRATVRSTELLAAASCSLLRVDGMVEINICAPRAVCCFLEVMVIHLTDVKISFFLTTLAIFIWLRQDPCLRHQLSFWLWSRLFSRCLPCASWPNVAVDPADFAFFVAQLQKATPPCIYFVSLAELCFTMVVLFLAAAAPLPLSL